MKRVNSRTWFWVCVVGSLVLFLLALTDWVDAASCRPVTATGTVTNVTPFAGPRVLARFTVIVRTTAGDWAVVATYRRFVVGQAVHVRGQVCGEKRVEQAVIW